jgi:hypothetical protein
MKKAERAALRGLSGGERRAIDLQPPVAARARYEYPHEFYGTMRALIAAGLVDTEERPKAIGPVAVQQRWYWLTDAGRRALANLPRDDDRSPDPEDPEDAADA